MTIQTSISSVRPSLSASFYPTDTVLSMDTFLLRLRAVKLHPYECTLHLHCVRMDAKILILIFLPVCTDASFVHAASALRPQLAPRLRGRDDLPPR
jgi:hypothetical protein